MRPTNLLWILCLCAVSCAPVRGDDDDDASASDAVWWTTCGDPVCSGWTDSGNPACTDQVIGASCDEDGALCDQGDGCNALLLCAEEDPKEPACPISLRSHKTDVAYLGPDERRALAAQAADLRLARWRYADPREGRGVYVGFLIDDVPAEAAGVRGERVDLYGYTTMAIAALQEQRALIEAQQAQIDALRAEVRALQMEPRR